MSGNNRFLFVVNPISGGRNKNDFIELINTVCSNDKVQYKVYETCGDNDTSRIIEHIKSYAPDVVVAAGGDGTCNLVAQCLRESESPAKFGIIPLGSANGLAKELGISEVPEEAIQILFKGGEKPLDALQINEEYLCLHLSDLGLNARLIEEFEKNESDSRGMLGYFKQLLHELVNLEPKTFHIRTAEKQFTVKGHMIAIANATKYGTGAILNPRGDIGDGKFEICIVREFPAVAIVPLTIKFFNGNIEESEFVEIFSCQEVEISNDDKVTLQVDGEIVGNPSRVTAKIYPAAFRVLVPVE